ncbi:MAG TPA: hypothetical protein VF354_03275 [Candidatus Methanoperedens sp.]
MTGCAAARDMTHAERKKYEQKKTSISKAQSYKEIGEYWDKHDIAENWEETKPAEFEIVIKPKLHMHSAKST